MRYIERGLTAPLLFCAVAFAAAGSVDASPMLWISALAAMTAVYCLVEPQPESRLFTPLMAAVVFFAAWIALTNRWLNPSYTAAAPYHAAFLFGGFCIGRKVGDERVHRIFGAALAFAFCLAGWALWQRLQ